MKTENGNFDAYPKVVCADAESTIEIVPRFDHCGFDSATEYEVRSFPCEQLSEPNGRVSGQSHRVRPVDGRLRIRQFFEAEQEHVLHVEESLNGVNRPIGDFHVYSLATDLFARRPFKGDLHLHSFRSDGQEAPAYVAGACRGMGLDFMAITDHYQYAPSLEAQDAFRGVDIDLGIFPGEEIHPPDNPVHIVNFGGSHSVNDLCQGKKGAAGSEYRNAVGRIQERLGALPPGVDAYQYASSVWSFDRVREGGGLGIFCHPYWFTENRYTPSGALTSYVFETMPFDALELISGFVQAEASSNVLQVARYHEERSKGRVIPIVGSSDAHGCNCGELFGWYYTVVFSPTPCLADLIESIKSGFSVAVESLPGEVARPFGPFRMVKFALFVLREVFPQHDALCVEEGRLMIEHAAGVPQAASRISRLKGRTASLLARCWGD